MSEDHAVYKVDGTPQEIRAAALLKFDDPGYQPPTPADVRALKSISGKTGRELCMLVGVEDQRTWRRWSQESDAPGSRQIPYSAWRLLLVESGLVK